MPKKRKKWGKMGKMGKMKIEAKSILGDDGKDAKDGFYLLKKKERKERDIPFKRIGNFIFRIFPPSLIAVFPRDAKDGISGYRFSIWIRGFRGHCCTSEYRFHQSGEWGRVGVAGCSVD